MIKKTLLSLALLTASVSSFAVNLVKNDNLQLDYNGYVYPWVQSSSVLDNSVLDLGLSHRHTLTLKSSLNKDDFIEGYARAHQVLLTQKITLGSFSKRVTDISLFGLTKYYISYTNGKYGQFTYGKTETVVGAKVNGPGEFLMPSLNKISTPNIFTHTFVYGAKMNVGDIEYKGGISYGFDKSSSQLGAYAGVKFNNGDYTHNLTFIVAGNKDGMFYHAADVMSLPKVDFTVAGSYSTFKPLDFQQVEGLIAVEYTPYIKFKPFAKLEVVKEKLDTNITSTNLSVGSSSRVYQDKNFNVDVYSQIILSNSNSVLAKSFGLGAKASW